VIGLVIAVGLLVILAFLIGYFLGRAPFVPPGDDEYIEMP